MTDSSLTSVEASTPKGVPYDRQAMAVSEWSADIYAALKDWAGNFTSRWEWWQPGYLVLTITGDENGAVEPVQIDTCEDELTVFVGMWETHLPTYEMPADNELALAVAEAKRLTEDWRVSHLLTVVFFDGNEKWCGSLTSSPEELSERLQYGVEWISNFGPKRAEVRSARRDQWRFFSVTPDHRLEEQISG
ncbi:MULTISPECIES: hypothetical protein [unclassified Brevundimonas]|uniref:hypothetical protein n=1 Tax=unclassified Brevundimonas TaxID=2622653 RepID=UPI000D44E13E|nr:MULTISPECIES: hypothetical protein [unclassified Brevundimonas]PRB55550.1 hypothetical protein CQ028_02815 [Brevundimonas sp. MYb33]